MSKQVKKTDSLGTRQGLRKLASEIMDKFAKEKSALANYYNIKGSGKDLFLIDALIPALDAEGILHDNIINIAEESDKTKIIDVSKKIAEWVYSNILKSKSKISNDLSGLEKDFFALREKLSAKKDKPPFAILINDINNLPFDDLDWFQSVVLEALVSSPGSMIVVTSQNEINWHSWEMRNKCESEKIPAFSFEEILDLCESHPLAQKILELSAGHPKTVQSLVNAAKQKKALSSFSEKDVNALSEEFVEILKREIDDNLYFKEKDQWLREAFYLVSAADGFDADLASDIIAEFNKGRDEKEKIIVPEVVTDIAWEMAYTGFAAWDFDEKTYKIVPELRERVVRYMEQGRKVDYLKVLEAIASSYLLRAEILSDWDIQITKYIHYTFRAYSDQDSRVHIIEKIKNSIDPFLKTDEEYKQLSESIRRENLLNPIPIMKDILPLLTPIETIVSPSTYKQDGEIMNRIFVNKPEIITRFLPRDDIKEYFMKLIKGELDRKWILHVEGVAGIGKTYLLNSFKRIAQKEQRQVINIDLHYPENRNASAILRQISTQAIINNGEIVMNAFDHLNHVLNTTAETPFPYMATNTNQRYNDSVIEVINAIRTSLQQQQNRPIIFLDTIDNTPTINQLTRWFLIKLLTSLKDVAYFVIAGRKPMTEIDKPEWSLEYLSLPLGPLNDEEIREFVFQVKAEGFDGDILESIADVSEGNPLTLRWICFYLMNFESKTDWKDLVNKYKKPKELINYISSEFWQDQVARIAGKDMSALKIGLRAAAHFGSHFNFEIFRSAVPEVIGSTHEQIFHILKESFYIRGSHTHWTLHDQVREWILEASSASSYRNTELRYYSSNAIEKYYKPKINKLESEKATTEDREVLDELKAQMFFHKLYVESTRGHSAKPYHYELWDYLDNLWHRYKLDQMAEVIQYGEDVRKWNVEAHKDTILECMLYAAEAWEFYSLADYEQAKKRANALLNTEFAPERLKATVSVVLGLIPSEDPELAIKKYLGDARRYYENILSILESSHGQTPSNEFIDSKEDIYPELHQVYMSIGRMNLIHSFDIEQGMDAFRKAYNISRKPNWWYPLYAAVAQNEWARILRFQGEFTEALNKIMIAITIYRKEMENPEADANYGYFYETLALICKELGQFALAHEALDTAEKIYENVPTLIDTRRATLLLERGHVYLLSKNIGESWKYMSQAHEIFEVNKEKNPWYYLNSLEKLGEYYMSVEDNDQAVKIFREQSELGEKYHHYLWKYWAEQHLAEIDFNTRQTADTNNIELLLHEYSFDRHLSLGPAYWETKKLLYNIAQKNNDPDAAIMHLAQGLTYVADHWRAKFWQGFVLLRFELLKLDHKTLKDQLDNLINLWKHEFPEIKNEPEHPHRIFLDMCESLRDTIV